MYISMNLLSLAFSSSHDLKPLQNLRPQVLNILENEITRMIIAFVYVMTGGSYNYHKQVICPQLTAQPC